MPRYADPTRCPDCGFLLPVDPDACPQCRLPLRHPLASQLFATLVSADQLLADLRATIDLTPTPALPANPTPTIARRRGLAGASVPRILLSLGALCLLVAAITFLAVAWSWLGVGGRTTILVGLTLLSGALGNRLARRDLRVAGEALTVVAFGLLALDVVGADNAGWLGDLDVHGLTLVVGLVLGAGALAMVVADRAGLVATQLVAALGLSVAGVGALGSTVHDHVVAVLVVLAATALVVLGRSVGAAALGVASAAVAGTWWTGLALSGLSDAGDHASVRALWLDGHAGGLVSAALLALLPLAFRPGRVVTNASAAVAAVLASTVVALPTLAEGMTRMALTCLVAVLVWSGVAAVVRRERLAVPLAPLALAVLGVLAGALELVAVAADNVVSAGDAFTRTAGVRLVAATPETHRLLLVPLVLGLVVAAAATVGPRLRRTVGLAAVPVVALAATTTLALFAVPLWTVVACLSAVGLLLVADGVRRAGGRGAQQTAVGGLVALLGVAAALPSAGLAAAATAVVVVGAAWCLLRGSFPGGETAAGAVLPLSLAGLAWSLAEAVSVDTAYRAAPVLLVVGLLAIALPRVEIEAAATLAVLLVAPPAIEAAGRPNTSLALHLTLAGALVTATALVHPSRRPVAWLGGLLLAAATWVRLADLGVTAPEAYTLPSAVALVLVGLWRLRRLPDSSTATALAPGLALATTPSLLWLVTGDPVSWRAVLLGLGCLALVLIGVRLRWGSPLVVGGLVGGLLALREVAPYTANTPQWVLIGLAGTLLTVVGVTWESRLHDIRQATAYLARLR
ncbi:SCO7613 C-terminal domain-containing membrane protein [Nocardioides sp. LS1]|uniref:SCO7613 C-terminal domain-containing membrane protein n=1 Tax=Nocardioides sp. LS1 TaxID=1027620 RepID=UPI000F617715|nr:DUF2157 domain-containing protein [Nocardioides sp. LS1]GCD90579.1 hypothetical protein NLS1_25850 [Nocardioides sp. LS1]